MKKTGFVLMALALLMALLGLSGAACAQSANPHAAEWLDDAMRASLDTLKRVDEAGLFYEMTCDYDYDTPLFQTLLGKFGQYDAGCSAFVTWNETGDRFLTARNYDYRHTDPDGAYTGLNVALHCAPEGKYKSIGIADACWLGLAGGAYYAGVLDDGTTDTSLAVLLPYLCVDGLNEKGVSVSILKLDVKEGETAVDQQEPGKVAIGHSVLARYILDNCATVEEAVALAKEYNIRNTGGMDFHLFVTDATGASVVLEWRYNQLTVTDTNAVTNYYVGYDDAEDRYKDGVCTEKATPLVNTVREYHYGYGHGYHRLTGIVSAVERYIDFTQESYMTKMTPAQAMKILSVAAQDPGTEATSMTQYSVIYNAQDATATVWLQQDYTTAYQLTLSSATAGSPDAGNTALLSLDANPSTGYAWTGDVLGGDAVQLDSAEGTYVPDGQAGTLVGAGGQTQYVVTAVQPGTSILVFDYRRSWEDAALEQRVWLAVVDQDLKLSMTDVTETGVFQGAVLSIDEAEHTALMAHETLGEITAQFSPEMDLPAPEEQIAICTDGTVNVIAWCRISPAEATDEAH